MVRGINIEQLKFKREKVLLLNKNFSYSIIDFLDSSEKNIKLSINNDLKEYLIEYFNLKNVISKYSSYKLAFLTQNFSIENIENSVISEKIGYEIYNGKCIILEINRSLNENEYNLIYMILENVTNTDGNGKLIIIYYDKKVQEKIVNYLKLRKIDDYNILNIEMNEMEYIKGFLERKGFFIPDKLIEFLIKKSSGDINKFERMLNILEKEGIIKNHIYSGSLSDYEIKNIENKISEKYAGPLDLNKIDEQSLNLLLIFSISIEPIKFDDLKNILKMDENILMNILDHFIVSNILEERNSAFEIKDKMLANFIIENSSKLKVKLYYQKLGEYYLIKGDMKKAGIYLYHSGNPKAKEILKKYFDASIDNMKFEDIIMVGRILLNMGVENINDILKMVDIMVNFQLISEAYEIIKNVYEKNNNDIHVIERYANILHEMGNYRESLDMIKNIDIDNLNDEDRLYLKFILARNLYSLTKYDESEKILLEIKVLAKNNYYILSRIYRLIGNINFYKNNLEKALEFYEESLKLDKLTNDIQGQISNMNNMAIVYSQKADFKKSKELYLNALEIAEKYWLPLNITTLYINLGIQYLSEIMVDYAIDFLEKGYRFSIFLKAYDKSVLPLIFLFDIYIKKGMHENALEYINEIQNYIDLIEVEEEKYQIMILRSLINKIVFNNDDENILSYSEILQKSEDVYYRMFGEMGIITYKFYDMKFDEAYELFEKFIEKYNIFSIEKYNNENIDYMVQYLEFVIFYNFIKNGDMSNEIENKIDIIMKLKEIENQPIYYVRAKILYLITKIKNENNSDEFIKIVENLRDLKYLYSTEKILYGLYYSKFKNDNSILTDGIDIMKGFIDGLKRPYLENIKNTIS
jgi:hypothetical protein